MKIIFLFVPVLIFLVSCNSNSEKPAVISFDTTHWQSQQIFWHWEEEFSEEEQSKMKEWITLVSDATQRSLGRFPFDLHYHFHRVDSAYQAVVFGHTKRAKDYQSAHFYVNPTFPFQDFMNDWIAPHEISHLAIPKIDKKPTWFFEGFATYLSRKVMIEMDVMTEAEADSTAYARVRSIKYAYQSSSNFLFVADSLLKSHRYPELYWGGGSYFHKADRKLVEGKKMPLVDILKYFQLWSHENRMTLEEIIIAFDRISQSTVFSDLHHDYQTLPAYEILKEY